MSDKPTKGVTPRWLGANGLWNPWTQRKRYRIVCGSCGHTYKDKVYFVVDTASSICPCCHAQNVWSHSMFAARYESTQKEAK